MEFRKLGDDLRPLRNLPPRDVVTRAGGEGARAMPGDSLVLGNKARSEAPAPTSPPPSWVKDAVFYQIFPERFANGNPKNDPAGVQDWNTGKPTYDNYFGGDIQGVIQNMPYLKDLGVNAIYFNPLFESPTNHKYAWSDYRIDDQFGSLQDFDNMVAAAHANGIKVIMDGVFNHSSDQHWAFQDAKAKGPGSTYWNDYFFGGYPVQENPPNYGTYGGFGFMPQQNVAGSQAMQDRILGMVDFYTRRGIDGWRLDVPLMIQSDDFWHKFRATVKGINPDAYIVGEAWQNHGDNPLPWVQGDKFDAVMNYQFYELQKDFFAHDSINADQFDLGMMALRNQWPAGVDDAEFNLIGSHDTSRFLFESGGDTNRLKLAATYQFTHPGAPVIYYGDEIGMTGGNDPDNRRPMAWNNINSDVHDFYKKLIGLRNQYPALRASGVDGQYDTLMRNNDLGQLAVYRSDGIDSFLVILNKGQNPTVTVDTTAGNLAKHPIADGTSFQDVLGAAGTGTVSNGKLTVNVGPEGEAILKLSSPAP